ncbi:hypothetical protein CDD83_3116 [Cordyceps sp. RAO-2017]|nr:hypothetical protein CDD83_3116 [Cordyceps sp. RAO-2017]
METVALAQGAAFFVGVGAHLAYFNKGEHHRNGSKYVQAATLVFAALAAASRATLCPSWSLSVVAYLILGIYTSLVAYRMLLHPLNRFPGPVGARLGDLWLSAQLGRNDMHEKSRALCDKYGPFVRVGSSTLMVAHPQAVSAIHGPESRCRKASMYDLEQPNRGIATRDRALHAARRRVWSRGFGDKRLREYEGRVAVYVELVLDRLHRAGGARVDATQLMNAFAFDVIGDLGLGRDFGMLRSGRQHDVLQQLTDGLGILARRLPLWLLRLLDDMPLVPTEATTGFRAFCHARLDGIMASDARDQRPIIMAPLLTHDDQLAADERDLSVLRNDCRFIIVAGGDTVAATLAFIFYYFAKHPESGRRLREELAPLRRGNRAFAHKDIQLADHLNAVINETLRLHPPASTITRVTPPEGIVVGDTLIPGGVTVFSSQYVLGRSGASYVKPDEFVPERWYSRPELIKDQAGYAPFSIGSYSCLGRSLALMEMRLLVAECVWRFDVSFAEGFDADKFRDRVTDCMSWHLGRLELCFTLRACDAENTDQAL